VEGVIDELGESLIQTVRRVRPQRLFLDGMEGFERAADFPERMSHVYSAIAQELERLGITTLYSTETRELFANNIQVPINGLSAATQNIVLLRHVEHRAAMLRVLAILKVRDDDYDARMRELRIGDDGIRLLDTFAGEAGVATGGGVPSDTRVRESEA
jgi:circadian clock protein KaiC